ncbi:MAG: hypothetical protein ABIA63_09650 [bacterium]
MRITCKCLRETEGVDWAVSGGFSLLLHSCLILSIFVTGRMYNSPRLERPCIFQLVYAPSPFASSLTSLHWQETAEKTAVQTAAVIKKKQSVVRSVIGSREEYEKIASRSTIPVSDNKTGRAMDELIELLGGLPAPVSEIGFTGEASPHAWYERHIMTRVRAVLEACG